VTLQATFAATLVDEWVRAGVRHAVVAPGSRSAPLAVALLADGRIAVHVRLDERSAAYFALGIGLASGVPAVVVTTSGTAAAECHPAVLEADLAAVPLIVCTADRPPRLHGVAAPQTLDQTKLFGAAVRCFVEPGVPAALPPSAWRSIGSRLVAEATGSPPGPVHANLAFDEPLAGVAEELPPGRPDGEPWHRRVAGRRLSPEALAAARRALAGASRGIVVAGAGLADAREAVAALAAARGWPVLAEPRAFPRSGPLRGEVVVGAFDALARARVLRERLAPDLVVQLGAPPASKALQTWLEELAGSTCRLVVVDAHGRFLDPARLASLVIAADPGELCGALAAEDAPGRCADPGWAAAWARADAAAAAAIDAELAREERLSEPAIARRLVAALPAGATLVASSSMPVRELEWFGAARPGAPRVLSNRGANGIDGVTSTTLGVAAATAGPVFGLLGDLAFLHDLSALVWGVHEEVPQATLVVVDNGGGAIFSFLEHASVLDAPTFERGLATPQRPDVATVARALGCSVREATSLDGLEAALEASRSTPGVSVVLVRVAREATLGAHRALDAVVASAVEAALA